MVVSFKQNPIGFKTFCKRFHNKQSNNPAVLFAIIKALEIAFEINLFNHNHSYIHGIKKLINKYNQFL
jgi:hypothetical protein